MRILFLTHRLPYAPNRGDRIRAYHLLRHMSSFASISLFSLVHDDEEAEHVGDVPGVDAVATARVPRLSNFVRGALSLPSPRPLTHALLNAPDARRQIRMLADRTPPDLVLAFCSGMAPFAMQPPLAPVPFVLDMVDVDSAKWREMGTRTRGPMGVVYRREARTLGRFEVEAARRARVTLVVNDREAATLRSADRDLRIAVVPNGIDLESFRPTGPPVDEPVVVFCGVLNYAPNEQGVQWFAREVWPIVRKAHPRARFVIVGAGATKAIETLAAGDAGIAVTGSVASVQAHLWQAAVSVAPLALARGVQNKVLEALAAGLPVAMTTPVAEGLPVTIRAACRTADTPEGFARNVIELLNLSAGARRSLAGAADLSGLAWPQRLGPLEDLFRRSADTPR